MVASAAALFVVSLGWVDVPGALRAVEAGSDVYAFLLGIVALAEIARYAGVFEWLAGALLRIARGSFFRLFVWTYALGTIVTIFLSNDTTAVILAPAVLAAVSRVGGLPRPHLYACAFVANAASFALPISNPANLVVFESRLPPLVPWLHTFGLPSFAAIALTFVALCLFFRRDIRGGYAATDDTGTLGRREALGGLALGASALALVVAAHVGWPIGYVALAAATGSSGLLAIVDRGAIRAVVRHLAWDVVVFVAGLFVVVAALDRIGGLNVVRTALSHAQSLGPSLGGLTIGAAIATACAVFNNLTVGLIAGNALTAATHAWAWNATLVAVDLGPNLAASGSLATMLWLAALRRDGIDVTWLEFLRVGAAVATPALAGALLLLR